MDRLTDDFIVDFTLIGVFWFPPKVVDVSKLFVSYGQDGDFASRGKQGPDTLKVNRKALSRRAMADIDRKLHHGESVFLQVLTKERSAFLSFFVVTGKSKNTNIHIIW